MPRLLTCLHVKPDSSRGDRQKVLSQWERYNNVPLNSAAGYVTPKEHAGGAPAGDPCGPKTSFADHPLGNRRGTSAQKALSGKLM